MKAELLKIKDILPIDSTIKDQIWFLIFVNLLALYPLFKIILAVPILHLLTPSYH